MKEDAHEILLGNMSISTDKYVREKPHLREWIIDSMEQYANQRVIEEVNEFKLWLYKEYSDKFIDIDITLLYKLFKKLKQQI